VSSSQYAIAVMPGDGVGIEILEMARRVLDTVCPAHGIELDYRYYDAGAAFYARSGVGITDDDLEAVGKDDAVLFGAMGLPDVRRPDGTEVAPQLDLRERYRLFASLRPARMFAGVRPTVTAPRADMLVIRETTEGLFAGRHDPRSTDPDRESDRMTITRATSEELFELAFAQAAARRESGGPGRVTLVDKSNVLKSNAFMRAVFDEVATRHPDIEARRLYVDAAAMLMVVDPEQFDVAVMENSFGDILSELAAGVTGGLGLAPSADVGRDHAVFQPCHGSAPTLVGKNLVNPIAMILSAAMMLDWLGQRHADAGARSAARSIDGAVAATLARGLGTPDIGGSAGTDEVTAAIVDELAQR
jgi:3-isopropylmalate dehydrogenase